MISRTTYENPMKTKGTEGLDSMKDVKNIQEMIKTYSNEVRDEQYSAMNDKEIKAIIHALEHIDGMIEDYLYGLD